MSPFVFTYRPLYQLYEVHTMPATSEKQRRLMAAAAHGATFPKAKALRKSMTTKQLKDFSKKSKKRQ